MPVRIIICKARRAGASTGVAAEIYDDTTSRAHVWSLIVANQSNPSENVLGMYTGFWRNTPESMTLSDGTVIKLRPDLPLEYRNNPPKDKLFFAEPLAGRIYIASAKALDAYLSFGFTNIHATEASRYLDASETFRELYSTLSIEIDSSMYVESTPNGQEGRGAWFYHHVMDASENKKGLFGHMELVFAPWHEMTRSFAIPFVERDKKIAFIKSYRPDERELLKRFPTISPEQFAWRRMMMAGPGFKGDEEKFDQEFPTDLQTAFLMSGTSVFTRKAVKRLMTEHVRPPEWEGDIFWCDTEKERNETSPHDAVRRPIFLERWQAKERGRISHVNEGTFRNLRVWRWPRKGDRLFVCSDVGEGGPDTTDGDWSTTVVTCLNEMQRDEVIMTWRGHIRAVDFAELDSALCWALKRLVGETVISPLLAPEWNGPGTAMCTYIDTKQLYPNLYAYQMPGVKGMPSSRHIGWESNAKTIRWAMGYMLYMIDRDMIDIPDERIVSEMVSYRKKDEFDEEGSFGAVAGRHDDWVAALRINCALMRKFEATNPGDTEVTEKDDGMDDTDLPDWDPYARRQVPGMDGITFDEFGTDDDQEENLWYNS